MLYDTSKLPQYVQDQLPFDLSVPQTQPSTNNYLANNRFQFIGGWSDKEKAFVYFPNNTAKTLGSVQARGIRALFAANGMKEGKDYVLDQQHELLKIFKKQNFLNS